MNRRNLFMLLRFIYLALDRSLLSIFGNRFRQNYIRISYRIKNHLFPEYGTYIPTTNEIGIKPQSVVWIPPSIPNWVLEEMKELASEIDPIIYPTDNFLANCQFYSFSVQARPGRIYRELIQKCLSDHYSHCFAIPWLKRGGSDLVTLEHIQLIAQTPGCRVLVIMTEPGDSPWLTRIPAAVDVLNVSCFVDELSHEELLLVIARILIQLKIDSLHIINSRHAWEVVSRYGLAITQQTRIFASIYCDDYDQYGQPVGFARQYLPNCYKKLTTVFSDNNAFPSLLSSTYGYNPELFRVLKSPVEAEKSPLTVRKPEGRKVLWAGRFDRQKRPDLLLGIARAMPNIEFHIYGDVLLDHKAGVISHLKKLKNVRMHGSFDGVENLPFGEFPVYLYTSQWDGTPTMIIAAALASIPIVASCVGGVGDIITEARGYPVMDIDNIALYVTRINEVLDNQADAEIRATAASDYVKCEHSEAAFAMRLTETPGYMPNTQTDKDLEPCSA